jgi:hypothetical protein
MESSVQMFNDTIQTTPAIAKKDLSNSLWKSHINTTGEKIAVYREEKSGPKSGRQILAFGHDVHPRGGFDPVTHDEDCIPKVKEQGTVTNVHKVNAQGPSAVEGPNKTQLVQQLQSIADRRASLLRQLNDLQQEEAKVLAWLSQDTSEGSKQVISKSPPRSRPSKRNMSVSRLPRLIPSKTYRKPRPFSAPSISTPSSTRSRAPDTVERVPLGDKTFTVFKDDCSDV